MHCAGEINVQVLSDLVAMGIGKGLMEQKRGLKENPSALIKTGWETRYPQVSETLVRLRPKWRMRDDEEPGKIMLLVQIGSRATHAFFKAEGENLMDADSRAARFKKTD